MNIKYAKSFLFLSIDKIVKLVSDVIVGGMIANYLTPKVFGIWQYTLSFSIIFGVFASAGLVNSVVIKELNNFSGDKGKIINSTIYAKLILGVISFIITITSMGIIQGFSFNNIYFQICIIFSLIFLLQPLDAIEYYYQYIEKPYIPIGYKIFIATAFIFFKICFIHLHYSFISFAILYVLELFSYYCLLFVICKSVIKINLKIIDFHLVKKLLGLGVPLILSSIFVTLYYRIDQIMIKEILSERHVGLYAAAARISEIWNAIPTIILIVFLPKIVFLKEENKKDYLKSLIFLYVFCILISLVNVILINYFSNTIIINLYGEAYFDSIEVLKIHIWSSILVYISILNSTILIIEGLTLFTIFIALLNVITNITFNFILLPKIGIIGSAYSVIVSYIVSIILFIILFKNKKYHKVCLIWLQSIF